MLLNVVLFLFGLLVLVLAAEALVRGSARVARALGVSPFVVGFTIVGFGTSAPELVVSLSAAIRGSPEIAVGNVVGSNIANIGVVLALAALVRPLVAQMRLLKVEMPVMIAVSLLLWGLCADRTLGRADNTLDRIDGAILLAVFLGMAVYMFRTAKEEPPEVKEELGKTAADKLPVWGAAVLALCGLVGLVGGAHLMVTAAVNIAKAAGVSEWLIGLTIVAVGTSLPEVAAGMAAAARGEADLALGNVAGSNLFNILLILGVTAVVAPMPISDSAVRAEIPVMIGFAVLMFAVVFTGQRVRRWEGALLLAAYGAFLAWQISAAR